MERCCSASLLLLRAILTVPQSEHRKSNVASAPPVFNAVALEDDEASDDGRDVCSNAASSSSPHM